jgi:hypothetical protein
MAGKQRLALIFQAFFLTLLFSISAWCDESEQNKAVATDLFDTGVRKMREGKCDQSPITNRAVCSEAREAFKRSFALYPAGLGALRNLAYVEQNLGLIASAARNFRELIRRAPLDPNPARKMWAEFAQKEFETLVPRIPHLTIEISGERPAGMTITLDNNALPEAGWDTALEIDPGEHTLRGEAPGYSMSVESFELAEKEDKRITVSLKKLPGGDTAAADTAPPTADEPSGPEQKPAKRSRLAPLIVTGAGVVTVGVGLGLGYVAIQKRKDACGDSHFCEPNELESGRSIAKASTIVTGAGAAVLAGGLIWYFLSAPPKSEKASLKKPTVVAGFGPQGAAILAHGTF